MSHNTGASKQIVFPAGAVSSVNPKFETAKPSRRMDLRQEAREHRWRRIRERLMLPLAVLLLVAGLLAAAWFVSADQRGAGAASRYTEKQLAEMKAAVEEHEQNFSTLVQRKARITEEDLAELEQAVAGQEAYAEAAGNQTADMNRLDALRTRLHIYRAERLREKSNELEAEATRAAEQSEKARATGKPRAEDADKAIALLRQALDAEKEIAQKWVLSNLDNPGRRARLDIRLRRMEADPLWEKGRALEREAEAAVASGNLSAAEKSLGEALLLERDYALRFRDVRATEFDRESRLQGKLDTVRSLVAKSAIDELVRQAQACEVAREWEKAAASWKSAAEAQLDLINRFPQSSHASRAQAEAYAAAQAQAQAMPEVEHFRTGMSAVRDLLRAGDTSQAAVQASSLAARVEILSRSFPAALPEVDTDRQQLNAIRERASSLGLIRESLVSQLVDLPGAKSRKLLRTEVSQALYTAVMGSNPSAKREPNRPVESLAYDEAVRFCTRLGWLTGLKVSLPDGEDYLAAQGESGREIPSEEAWTIDTSDGQVRPVGTSKPNPLGFHDLCGNVAEWVRTDDGQPTAFVAGGDAQSALESSMTLVRVDRREASRLRGFRIAVDR